MNTEPNAERAHFQRETPLLEGFHMNLQRLECQLCLFGCVRIVKSWYDEIQKYDFQRATFVSGTGHFSQVVWKGLSVTVWFPDLAHRNIKVSKG